MSSQNDEASVAGFIGVSVVGFGLSLLVIFSLVAIIAKPAWLRYEREVFVNSHQYVEARSDEVNDLVNDYQELETRLAIHSSNEEAALTIQLQLDAIEDRIIDTCNSMHREQIPASAQRFLR